MTFTIQNFRKGPYQWSVVGSMKELRREIRGESPRNLRVTVQRSLYHQPEQVVITEGPRGGLHIHLP